MNQEMNPENPPQNAVPGLRLGFPSVKGIFLQRCLFLTIQASGAKTPGRDGRLQGHFVIPDLYFIQVHPGAFAESWLVLQHWLILQHFPEAHCSATNQFAFDGPKYFFPHGWQLNAQRWTSTRQVHLVSPPPQGLTETERRVSPSEPTL